MKQILIPVLLALSVFSVAASGQGSSIASAVHGEFQIAFKKLACGCPL
jgi:hypothetical protein